MSNVTKTVWIITLQRYLQLLGHWSLGSISRERAQHVGLEFATEEEAEDYLVKNGYGRCFNDRRRTYDWDKYGPTDQAREVKPFIRARIYCQEGNRIFNPYCGDDDDPLSQE